MHKQIRLVLEKSKAVCQEVISVIRIFIHHLSIIFINSIDHYKTHQKQCYLSIRPIIMKVTNCHETLTSNLSLHLSQHSISSN